MSDQIYFRGPPRFDVGLRPIGIEQWLQPDDQSHWLTGKNDLIDTRPHDVFAMQARSLPAQTEIAQRVAMQARQKLNSNEPPLLAASRLVSDDLVVMEQTQSAWVATACCLCSPTFFSAEHALGKSLAALHAPIPDDRFGLAARIDRVFTNSQPNAVLERHNWTVQWSDARYTPDGAPLRAAAQIASTDEAAENLFLRVERQTIIKFPDTQAILFTIRIRLSRLGELLTEADHAKAFAKAWADAPTGVRVYKKWAVLDRHVEALLRVP